MAITNARMQMRRGLEADFDPDKMQPGEWAVSLDKKYVRMCFSVGVCVRMATYDAFEEDMAQIEAILKECKTIEEAITVINTEVSANAKAVAEYTEQAKKYRDEAKAFRDEVEQFAPDGYVELKETVASNTAKIDTIIEKAELNIKNSASGENIHLTDSANGKNVAFGLYGKAEQFVGTITDDEGNEIFVPNPDYPQEITVSGESYNLLENTATSQTIADVTFTVNDDGSVTANGTATNTIYFKVKTFAPMIGENYILSGCPSGGSTTTYRLYWNTNNKVVSDVGAGAMTDIITNNTTSNNDVIIFVNNGTTINNLTFYPMIRKASVKNNRYMPYGVGSVEVVSCGKNLIHYPYYGTSGESNGVMFTDNNGIITADGTNNSTSQLSWIMLARRELFKKGVYAISGTPLHEGKKYWIRVMNADSTTIATDYGNGATFELLEDTPLNIAVMVSIGGTVNNVTFYPMIRLASDTDDNFEPYTETVSTIPTPNGLCGIKVSSGGNYTDENGQQWICDEIVKYADGSGKRIERIKHYSLAVADMNNGEIFPGWENVEGLQEVLGDYNETVKNCILNIGGKCSANTVSNTLYLSQAQYGLTGTEWKTNYPDLIVDIYLARTTPIETPLTAEEIAEIEKLHTFYPITNISNDADCGMSITYMADAKRYIDQRLALIESAMLNNI